MNDPAKRRHTVSVSSPVFRNLAFAADRATLSRSAWVTKAIAEKLSRENTPRPPDDWEPEGRPGRPPTPKPSQYFTF